MTKMKVVPTGLPGVENDQGLDDNLFTLSRGSQLPYTEKTKMMNQILLKKIQLFYRCGIAPMGLITLVPKPCTK